MKSSRPSIDTSTSALVPSTAAVLADLPVLSSMLSRLFESSQHLDDVALHHLIDALRQLSQEAIEVAYSNRVCHHSCLLMNTTLMLIFPSGTVFICGGKNVGDGSGQLKSRRNSVEAGNKSLAGSLSSSSQPYEGVGCRSHYDAGEICYPVSTPDAVKREPGSFVPRLIHFRV